MFVLGQHNLVALDAYNGRELWSRALPSVARRVVDIWGGSMVGDPQNLYVATGDLCLRFDAASGALRPPYRLPLARPRFDLSSPQTIELDALDKVEIRNTPEALLLKLTTVAAAPASAAPATAPRRSDWWELFFDFRPQQQRTCLYGPGAFQVIVAPATKENGEATCRRGTWSKPPLLGAKGAFHPPGSETELRIAWADIAKLTGAKPADFNFGVILDSSDDGKQVARRIRRFANDASYRLANCWATLALAAAPAATEPAGQPLLAAAGAEQFQWGNLTVSGEVVLGTVVASKESPLVLARGRDFASEGHDYTGPPVNRVLDIIGLESEARGVFALYRGDGRPRWIYTPLGTVPHNGIAVGNGRVYLLDKGKASAGQQEKPQWQRGQPSTSSRKTSLEVLDLATGKRLWRLEEGLERHDELRLGHGVLLASNMGGMTAYDADNGKKLWSVAAAQPMHHCSAFLRAPVITGNWVYDEPYAYDLRTGASRKDPSGQPWRWGGFRGCGTVSAGENMLLFRSGTPGFVDVAACSGPSTFPGIRPGCYINMIVAGGLVLMPEASSGCSCPYNFQTTVTLFHAAKQ
jgi:outer membrane protein assembly factor BamB